MPPGQIKHTFHVVPELPYGGSVLVVDTEGDIHTYVSRASTMEDRWADLGWAFTVLAQSGDYERCHQTA